MVFEKKTACALSTLQNPNMRNYNKSLEFTSIQEINYS